MFARLDFCTNLIMHHAEKNKHVLITVRIEKYFVSAPKTSLGLRPRALFEASTKYFSSAKTKRDWLIHCHMALDKCNVSLGQQVNNCCPLRPTTYINKQNGGETCKFINSDFRAFCLKKYTIDREDMF